MQLYLKVEFCNSVAIWAQGSLEFVRSARVVHGILADIYDIGATAAWKTRGFLCTETLRCGRESALLLWRRLRLRLPFRGTLI